MKTMIVIYPFGGLGNRLRVIASAISLNKEFSQEIVVVWDENENYNCPFSQLFEPINGINISKPQKKYKYLIASIQINIAKRVLAYLVNLTLGFRFTIFERDFHLIWKGNIDISELVRKYKRLYIHTCQEFGDNYVAFKLFKPVLEIRQEIDFCSKKIGKNTIGVHIRRTDHNESISKSPLERFIHNMDLELNSNPDTNFYLATDDNNVAELLINRYSDEKVIHFPKQLDRNTKEGAIGAVVDLYCLSLTSKIFGSYWSSFSDIAARIGGIKCIIVKNEKND